MTAIRAEMLKMRTMPGVWVTFGLAFPLTILYMTGLFAAQGYPGHTFSYVQGVPHLRQLLGAGYFGITFLAPILGVICITGEYRNKTMTSTFVLTPVRTRVLAAKVFVTTLWCVLIACLTLVTVFAIGLAWNAALGGVSSQVVDQFGAVVPGLLASTILLGLFGLGFGTLVKNQVAAILITIGTTFILEMLLVLLARAIFHYNLNWLPSAASQALAGLLARGLGNRHDPALQLLSWWKGGLVMLAWGLIPLALGYFTTFRRDVT
ncbi:MAG TPA: ABC transporter permease [Acidimicrobiales bacterium]|nr:ABC transporter permease [Acidimicrobiales bacterium]